jgi:hypothetical protein
MVRVAVRDQYGVGPQRVDAAVEHAHQGAGARIYLDAEWLAVAPLELEMDAAGGPRLQDGREAAAAGS